METDLSATELVSVAVSMLKISSSNIMFCQAPVYMGQAISYNGNSTVVVARQETADLLNEYFRENTGPVDASQLNIAGDESKELAIRLARALDAKKGYNIRILHVENLTTVTDYFVIATGNSTTHVGALADEADFQLGRAGVNVLRTEGHDGNRWVLLDYGSVIVHVFTPEVYDLEHLWADAKELPAEEWEEKPEEQA